MIHVIATVHCKPGSRDAFLAEFHQIIPDVLQEAGCIEYGPTIDAKTELSNQQRDGDRVMIIEKWESLEALHAHLVAPHMQAYRPKVKGMIDSTQLYVLQNA